MRKTKSVSFQEIQGDQNDDAISSSESKDDKLISTYLHYREVDATRAQDGTLLPYGFHLDIEAITQASQTIVREHSLASENLLRLNQIIVLLDAIKKNSNEKMSEAQQLHQDDKRKLLEKEALSSFNCLVKSRMQIETECDEICDAASTIAIEIQDNITQETMKAFKRLNKAIPTLKPLI